MARKLTLTLTCVTAVLARQQVFNYTPSGTAISSPSISASTTALTPTSVISLEDFTGNAKELCKCKQPVVFFGNDTPSLEQDLKKDGKPVMFADGSPKHWGAESASITLPNAEEVSTISINTDETLLAVGWRTNVMIYQMPSLKHLQTIREAGQVTALIFQPHSNRLLVTSNVRSLDQSDWTFHNWKRTMRLVDLENELAKPFTQVDQAPPLVQRLAAAAIEGVFNEMQAAKVEVGRGQMLKLESFFSELVRNSLAEIALHNESLWLLQREPDHQGYDTVLFSPDGSFLVHQHTPHCLHVLASSNVIQEQFRLDYAERISISPGGLILTGTVDSIKLWNSSNGALVRTIEGIPDGFYAVFSPNGRLIAAPCTNERKAVCVWRTDDGQLIQTFADCGAWELPVFSPDSEYLIVPEFLGVSAFRVNTGEKKFSWKMGDGPSPYGGLEVMSVQFDKEGRLFIQNMMGTIFAYDMVSNVKWQFGPFNDVAWRNPTFLATKYGLISPDSDGIIKIWSLEDSV